MAEPGIETETKETVPVTDCDTGLHFPLALNADNKIICHRCGHVYIEIKPAAVKRIKDKTKKVKKGSPKRRG